MNGQFGECRDKKTDWSVLVITSDTGFDDDQAKALVTEAFFCCDLESSFPLFTYWFRLAWRFLSQILKIKISSRGPVSATPDILAHLNDLNFPPPVSAHPLSVLT